MNIKLLEEVTYAFLEGDTPGVISILKTESSNAKQSKKKIVSRRLDNLVKKIPNKNNYTTAGLGSLNRQNSDAKKVFLNNPDLISEFKSNILPEEVVLNQNAKEIIATFFREWEDREKLQKHGFQPTNKILLYGPPGTGKTKLAYAIANQLDFPLILVRLDELVSSFLGKTGQNIREIFNLAKQKDVILFLDEIDTVAKHRADDRELGELKRIVTVLLQNIDLFSDNSIIIGATNHENILDKAVWRRFPLKIKLELPNKESRKLLFSLFLGDIKKKIDLNFLVKITEGLNGSEILDISQQAIKNNIISQNPCLTTNDLVISHFQLTSGNRLYKNTSKKDLYKVCQRLKNKGYKLRDIENITKIPYTTLRDNLK